MTKKTIQPTYTATGAEIEVCECGEERTIKIIPKLVPVATLLGDVTLDKKVDIKDLTRLARKVAEIEPLTDPAALKNADTTGDNKIDIKDLTRLARAVAEIEPF